MNKIKLKFWGRESDLGLVFDCYVGEEVLQFQQDAVNSFLKNAEFLLDEAQSKIKQYCLKVNPDDISETDLDNIFRFVRPKDLFIKRDKNQKHIVALMCSYKYNPEAGIAVIFRDEKYAFVGTQNEIL